MIVRANGTLLVAMIYEQACLFESPDDDCSVLYSFGRLRATNRRVSVIDVLTFWRENA